MTGFTLTERGYTENSDSTWRGGNNRKHRMWLQPDDCAMVCDSMSDCRSITSWNESGKPLCMINTVPVSGLGRSEGTPSWYTNGRNYDKPTTSPITTTYVAKVIPSRNKPMYDVRSLGKNAGPLEDGGKFSMTGSEYCNFSAYEYYNTASGGQIGQNGRSRFCLAPGTGAKTCDHITGKVSSVRATNEAGTGGPSQSDTNDVGFVCSYNDIDNAWIQSNWNSLSNFFDAENMEKVKQQFCDTSSPATIAGSPGNNYCKQFILNKNGQQPDSVWYNYLTDNMSKRSGWSSDQDAIRLVVQSCKNGGADTGIGCNTAINTLPVGSVNWSSPLISGLNDLNSSTVPADQLKTLSEKVDEYCSTQETAAECSCRNAVKYGVDGCTADKPGCADLFAFKTFKDSLSASGTPNYGNIMTLINGIRPRVQAQACIRSDGADSENILQFKKPQVGDKIQINACIQTLQNSGTLDVNKIDMACDISAPQTTTAPGTGENSPVEKVINEVKNASTPIKIGAGVLCCILVIVFILLMI